MTKRNGRKTLCGSGGLVTGPKDKTVKRNRLRRGYEVEVRYATESDESGDANRANRERPIMAVN